MYEHIQSKTILSSLRNGPDPWFGISYSMNVYRGCSHSCIYCDTRSLCYNIGDLSRIRVKINAPQLLARELSLKKTKRTIGTGSMNDPYMSAEKDLGIVGKCLEVISFYKFPVHIMTKNDLVIRDIEQIKELSKTYAAVSFTVTCAEDVLSSVLEPGAPPSSVRFKTIKTLAKQGVYTGISMMPLLPLINDTEENIRSLYEQAAGSGASYVIPVMGLTQRDGQREYFYQKLDEFFPGFREQYVRMFGNSYHCQSPFSKQMYELCGELSDKYKIPLKMKHFTPAEHGTQTSIL